MPKAAVITALVLSCLVQPALAQDESEAAYLKEYKHGKDQTYDCFGAKKADACVEMIKAYERAMAAPDVTEGVHHYIFKDYVHAITVYGAQKREAEEYDQAINILGQAFTAMMTHYENGKHFHTFIDNLRLQRELVLTLAELGRLDEADNILNTARQAADRVYEARAQFENADEHQKELLYTAFLGSEELETEVGHYFKDRSLDQREAGNEADAQASRDRAIVAYGRADEWLHRKLFAGIRSHMDVRYEIRYSEIQVELGLMHMHSGHQQEAQDAFVLASLSCMLLDPADAAKLDLPPAQGFDIPLLEPVCERASLGWALMSGEADRLIEQAVDQMIEREMQFLEEVRPGA